MNQEELKDNLKASYMSQSRASDYMHKKYGYSYDPQLSTMEQKVFIDKTGQPIITERGSKRVSDWMIEGPSALLGYTNTRRVNNAEQLSKQTKEKYNIAPINIGHSLGGYLAEKAGDSSSKTYTYNKLAGIPSVFSDIPKNQYDYRTTLDIPSFLGQYQNGNKENISGSYNPIEIHDVK